MKNLPLILAAVAVAGLIPSGIYGQSAFVAGETLNPYRAAHIVYTLFGIIGAIILLCVAAWVYAGRNETTDRTKPGILLASGWYGALVMLAGFSLLIVWFESLAAWLGEGKTAEAYKVLIPVLVIVLGGAIMFLGTLPARGLERNSPTIRRLIYGTNLGLTTLLLIFALVAVNILVSLKLPARLDTTETGFYTLADSSKAYIAGLQEPITVTTSLVPDIRYSKDAVRLLESLQETNPKNFTVDTVRLSDGQTLGKLKAKYPKYDFAGTADWVLLTAGDGSRSAFLTLADMLERGERGQLSTFGGEGKIMREVRALTDTKNKPIVYFTQGHGELELNPNGTPGRGGTALKASLEKNYAEVRTWVPDLADPKVPDDAAAVIVADPKIAFSPAEANALRQYMIRELPEKRKGKLIILSSPYPNADGKGVADTGLETVLLDYGITLGNGYLVAVAQRADDFTTLLAGPTQAAVNESNPIGMYALSDTVALKNCRRVDAKPGDPEAQFAAMVVLLATPQERPTWMDPDPPTDPAAEFEALRKSRELQQKLGVGRPNPLVAIGTENRTPRLVVIGSGASFADGRTPPPVTLVATALDWLRDRPTLAAINKSYTDFKLPPDASGTRLFWLPVGLVIVSIAIAGIGVWTVRRS